MSSFQIELTRESEADLEEVYQWYRAISQELADRFAKEVIVVIDSLAYFPLRFRVRFKNYRSISMSSFPYCIFYRVLGDRVQIAKVWHEKRDKGTLGI